MFKSGEYVNNGQFTVFQPSYLMDGVSFSDQKIQLLLIEASRHLGELNAYSQFAQDVDFFISMSTFREATSSNQIEGASTSLKDALIPQEKLRGQTEKDDWREVHNCIEALRLGLKELERSPLAFNTICKIHKRLLSGVRGKNKSPGRIRKNQNWIGGVDPTQAIFVPPPANLVAGLLSDLDKYWHNDKTDEHPLFKIAVIHYQFETIHPFLDGNGRLGRLLIVLQLIESGILKKPAFYISEYIEKNRRDYYELLNYVHQSEHGFDQWLVFFLEATIQTAKRASQTLKASLDLRQEYRSLFGQHLSPLRQVKANLLLKEMFGRPIINVGRVSVILKCSRQSANEMVKDLMKIGILKPIDNRQRNRDFVLAEYFKLFTDSPS